MGRCVTYIHCLCMTLTFDLNIKIIFSLWICVLTSASLLFDIGIPNLAHKFFPCMRQHIVYIHDLCMTLIFHLYVDVGGVSLVSFTHIFYLVITFLGSPFSDKSIWMYIEVGRWGNGLPKEFSNNEHFHPSPLNSSTLAMTWWHELTAEKTPAKRYKASTMMTWAYRQEDYS